MKQLTPIPFLVFLLLAWAFPPALPSGEPPAATRVLKVKAVADEAFRKDKNWEKKIRDHFLWADKEFRQLAQVGLELVATDTWTTHGKDSMSLLLNELRASGDKGEADIVIGFTGHKPPELTFTAAGQFFRLRLSFIAGIALPYGDRAVVRKDRRSKATRHTLLHEIAHLFGGMHVKEKSVLQTGTDREYFELDPFNRKIFELTRQRDFGRAARDLDRDELDPIIDLYREAPLRNETDTDTNIRIAYMLLAVGNVDEAIKEFEKAMEIDPKSSLSVFRDAIIPELVAYAEEHQPTVLSRYTLGQAYFLIDELSAASRQLIPNCVGLAPHAASCSLLGAAFFKAEDLQQAERVLRRALELDDSLADAYNVLGSVYAAAGYHTEALEHYNRAEELDPEITQVHFNKGLTLLLMDMPGPAADSFRKVLKLREEHEGAYLKLSLALAREGDTKEARKRIRKYEQENSLSAFTIRDMAEIFYLSGDTKKATKYVQFAKKGGLQVEELEEQIRLGRRKPPKVKTADLIAQAEAYYRSERYATARELLARAIEKNPKKPEPHYWLGRVAGAEERPEEAVQHHQKALALDPKFSSSYLELAELAEEREEYSQAVEYLNRYMEYRKRPGSYSHYLLARCQHKLGELEAAEENLRQAVQRRADYGNAFYLLGVVLLEQDRKREAANELRLAVDSRSLSTSRRPRAYYELAKLLLESGHHKQALRYARIAERFGHEDADTLLAELEQATAQSEQP